MPLLKITVRLVGRLWQRTRLEALVFDALPRIPLVLLPKYGPDRVAMTVGGGPRQWTPEP